MQAEQPVDSGLANPRLPWLSLRKNTFVPGGRKATHILSLGGRELPVVLVGWRDGRWGMIIAQGLFNIIGLTIADFRIPASQVLAGISVACLTEILIVGRRDRVLAFPASALISGLGLGFLLRSDLWWVHPLCAFLCVASKYVLVVEGKHLNSWITSDQFGTWLVWAIIAINASVFVVYRVRRLHVCAVWYVTLSVLVLSQAAFSGLHFDDAQNRLFNGILIIFTFFMITDPKTSPNTFVGRVVYAFATAVLTFVLMVSDVRFAEFFALFFITSVVPLVDWLLSGERFMWETEKILAGLRARSPASAPPA
jgi:Na+-translocating ferredoxin:NAD+ oxidoreductase RnfD subunit